jgi:hypothetical protein
MNYPFNSDFMPDNLAHLPKPTIAEPFACIIGEALWVQYRERYPSGLTVPLTCPEDVSNPIPELIE